MNDHDVVASKGKQSRKRLQVNALGLRDLTHTRDDMGLERQSISEIQESLDPFVKLLDFPPRSLKENQGLRIAQAVGGAR